MRPRWKVDVVTSARRTTPQIDRTLVTRGKRVVPAPRSAPAATKLIAQSGCMRPSGIKASSAMRTTSGSVVKIPTSGPRRKINTIPSALIQINAHCVAMPAACSPSSGFAAPMLCPTSAVAAIPNPKPGKSDRPSKLPTTRVAASEPVPRRATTTVRTRNPAEMAICSTAAGAPRPTTRRARPTPQRSLNRLARYPPAKQPMPPQKRGRPASIAL